MSLNEHKKNIAAGIVLYNPELSRLQENITHIIEQVDKVILFDNGSGNISSIDEMITSWSENIVLLRNDSNIGIAAALNRLCKWCFDKGYQYIITLDHDSVCSADTVSTLIKDMEPGVAISAPNIVYRNNESFAEKKQGKEQVEWVITSASLTDLSVWDKLGGFDEKLFIDGVDRDFCQRANRRGYRIIKDYDIELMHELGNLKCRKVLGRTIYVTNHSPLRKYYMIRNGFYLSDKLKEGHPWIYVIKSYVKIIAFEDNKMEKLKEVKRGIIDGLKMRGGNRTPFHI